MSQQISEKELLTKLLEQRKRYEDHTREEIDRAKMKLGRVGYEASRTPKQKQRDLKRLETLTNRLIKVMDERQQTEALLLSRDQVRQGAGLIAAALSKKTKGTADE